MKERLEAKEACLPRNTVYCLNCDTFGSPWVATVEHILMNIQHKVSNHLYTMDAPSFFLIEEKLRLKVRR